MNLNETKAFKELVAAVDAELEDPNFVNRTHGSMSAYNKGCKGPMCTKANTDRRRGNHKRGIEDEYIEYRQKEYLDAKLAAEAAARAKVRPPGTTRADWREERVS